MPSGEITKSLLGGLIAGAWSGFLGVSPGGFLVPIISLLLPFAQHEWISLGIATPDALFVRGPDWNWIRRRTLVGPAGHWRGTGDTALSVGLLHKHQHEAQTLRLAVTAFAADPASSLGLRTPGIPAAMRADYISSSRAAGRRLGRFCFCQSPDRTKFENVCASFAGGHGLLHGRKSDQILA